MQCLGWHGECLCTIPPSFPRQCVNFGWSTTKSDSECLTSNHSGMATEEKTKVCKCCGKELPLSEFYIAHTNKDGHKSACRKCESQRQREKYARLRDRFISKSVTKEETKVCACCEKELPLSEFYTQSGNKDGHTGSWPETKTLGIADFSDSMLVAELRRRGYTGELRFSKTVAI